MRQKIFLTWVAVVVMTWGIAPVQAQDPGLRIRIHASTPLEQATIKTTGGHLILTEAGTDRRLAVVAEGEAVAVERYNGILRMRWPQAGALTGAVTFSTSPEGQLLFSLENNQTTRRYRGHLSLYPSAPEVEGLLVVNTISLEDYVASVLPAEYPFKALEGVKAQAVAIRTYALAASRKFGTTYDLADTEASQVYHGVERETDLSRRATAETRGQVLIFEDDLIEAVFSSQCGGHTADNETVWSGQPVAYLRGKPDAFEGQTPDANWTSRLNREQVLQALSEAYGMQVEGFTLRDTTPEGRVGTIDLLGRTDRTIRANEFRSAINHALGPRSLKSTLFDARRQGQQYVFTGKGLGHGVGLCQYGTHARAEAGHSYRDILNFYYTGVAVSPLQDSVSEAPSPDQVPVAEAASRPARSGKPKRRAGW